MTLLFLIDTTTEGVALATIISAAVSILTLIFNIIISACNARAKRSDISMTLLHNLVTQMDTSPSFNKTFYLFDYNKEWFSEAFHDDFDLQNDVDATLSFLSCICYFRMSGRIDDKQFDFFAYRITRTLNDKGVQDYLYNLYHFSKQTKTPMPFCHLFLYAEENELLLDGFKDIKNPQFTHTLDF